MNTTTRTLLAAAITAFSFAAAPQAHAFLTMNGLSANGLGLNGLAANGLTANGLAANGLGMNGHSLSGQTAVRPDDASYCARKLFNYDPALCGNSPAGADASAQPVVKTIVLPTGRQLNLR